MTSTYEQDVVADFAIACAETRNVAVSFTREEYLERKHSSCFHCI